MESKNKCALKRTGYAIAAAFVIALGVVSPASAKTLYIGKISDEPGKDTRALKPMVEHVAAQMADLGITGSEVVLAKSEQELVTLMLAGKVDWVTETAFSAIALEKQAGAKILLRKWKKGVAEYHSVIFTRKRSGVDSIEDLAGKKIAFEHPSSTSGFHVPYRTLASLGLKLELLSSEDAKPTADTVGYLFSGDEIKSTLWVRKKVVSAAAINNTDWYDSSKMPPVMRNRMKILHRSASIPRALEVVRGDMDPAISRRLANVLMSLADDPSAADLLKSYERTTRFDRIDQDLENSIDEVRKMLSTTIAGTDQ